MQTAWKIAAGLVVGILVGGASPQPPGPGEPVLIPRALLFGNPVRTGGQISPDGKRVSWLAPVDGVLNVWVAPIERLEGGKPFTHEIKRGLREYHWAPDSDHILYSQDSGGNENFHIRSVSVTTGKDVDLTPVSDKVRAEIQATSRLRPEVVLIGINDRNPELFDLYEVDYRTGARKLVLQNPGYGLWLVDNQLRPRFGGKQSPGGGTTYFRRNPDGSWSEVLQTGAEDAFTTNFLAFDRDGSHLFWFDSRGRDKAALVRMDAATLKTEILGSSDKADAQLWLVDPVTFTPTAFAVNYLKNEWTGLTPKGKADIDFLRARLPGEFDVVNDSDDGMRSIVVANAAEAPSVTYLYDRRAKTLTRLFDSRPALAQYPLQPMWPVEIRTGDGETLVSYLTLPANADANRDGKPDRPVPLVLYVHGGPWARDDYGYDPTHQWLANRGYAVLSVNYRGSTGFGKRFVNIAAGQWSGAMHQDLIDAVDWAIRSGVTTRDQVAIMGGSYGGYATLVGVTFTPDRFRCGVDIVGPSNLKTLMESFPPYWRPILEGTFYKHIGDPAKPEDAARMLAQSPISRVGAIKVPLLIGQGANDPRVVQRESDQIVAAMQAKKLPVTYVLYPDEGHGFQRPQNRLSFYGIAEAFLSRCLGGAVQPVGGDFRGSSLQVPVGADDIPGLSAALAAK